jgi:hypothetical protein
MDFRGGVGAFLSSMVILGVGWVGLFLAHKIGNPKLILIGNDKNHF